MKSPTRLLDIVPHHKQIPIISRTIAGRVAQALHGIANKVGAPSFAPFAKGGSRDCLRKWDWSHDPILAYFARACPELVEGLGGDAAGAT